MVLNSSLPGRRLSALCASLLIAAAVALPVHALSVPPLTGRVVDNGNALSTAEKQEITSYLDSLDASTGIQIAVLTIPSLEGEDIETYGIHVADAWKLGQKGKDNGALLLIALADHKVRIETGYGLEDKLTDAKSGLIIRNIMTPQFRTGNYGKGILDGVKNMGGIASDNAALVSKSISSTAGAKDDDAVAGLIFGIIFFVFWLMILPNIAGHRHSWLPMMFFPMFMGGGSVHHHDDTHFGGGFGGGGGGFSGGGGGFGGGGASGSW
jgi:uncharacterized protein